MNLDCIRSLYKNKSVSVELEAGITLKIKDDVFRPGTVRVHLPAPINASWLKEGQLIDSEPMFRMMSVEDYPQRSAYFNEILSENTPFNIIYAFSSEHTYVCPDIKAIDNAEQKSFTKDEIARFSAAGHCGCESYTALPVDRVTIKDVAEEKGLKFKENYKAFLKDNDIDTDHPESLPLRGTLVKKIYDLIVDSFIPDDDETFNIAFVSMCRMCGIPARWQGGWAVDDIIDNVEHKQSPAVFHNWAMIHLLPYGWVYVDCDFARKSGTNTIPGTDTLLKDFFFGNIDPCMVPTASAPATDLYPAKDYPRADEVFNTRGEVELIPGKMNAEEIIEGYGLKADEFETAVYIQV